MRYNFCMTIQTVNFDSPLESKRLFDELVASVFGFTFRDWYTRGWWNQDYTCYAIIENGRMLANASTYRMDMLLNGEKHTWLQLGAVATCPELRGQGFSRRIMEHILAQHAETPMLLCANPSVHDFYPKFGFRRLPEHWPVISHRLERCEGVLKRLSVDDPRVREILTRRACFSEVLDCANAAPIQFFHLLHEYPDSVFEIPQLGALLVAERDGHILHLVDVCATQPLTWADLLPYLNFSSVDTIEFGFNPDWLGVECQWVPSNNPDAFFIRGKFPIPGNFIFPAFITT
jgi:GNAT superfamily N-acetyltransferase